MFLLSKKSSLVVFLFAFTGFFSIIANFSRYYFSGSLGILLLSCIASFLLSNPNKITDKNKRKQALLFLLVWLFIYLVSIVTSFQLVPLISILYIIFGSLLLSLKQEKQHDILHIFLDLYCLLLFLSLLEFLIFFITGRFFISTEVIRSNGQVFYNLIFNLVKITPDPRFQSLADEPGLIGTLNAFLIYALADNRKYKYHVLILIVSGIVSFSLAFYIMFLFKLVTSKINLRLLLPLIIGCAVVFYFTYDIFEVKIQNRLQQETIDNRSTYIVDKVINESIHDGSILLGKGYNYHEKMGDGNAEDGGAGAKIFLIEFGAIGFLLIIVLYTRILFKNNAKTTFQTLIFISMFWISFYQRQTIDRPYTMIALIAFIIVSSKLETNTKKLPIRHEPHNS